MFISDYIGATLHIKSRLIKNAYISCTSKGNLKKTKWSIVKFSLQIISKHYTGHAQQIHDLSKTKLNQLQLVSADKRIILKDIVTYVIMYKVRNTTDFFHNLYFQA